MKSSQDNILIAAATITADLSTVRVIAREMSLGVMNAKAISNRAGDTARGFQPITDFIDEMARGVMDLVELISKEALNLSRLAVDRHIHRDVSRYYQQVHVNGSEVANIASIIPIIEKQQRESLIYQEDFLKSTRKLNRLLEDINRSTRGAQVIATTSLVEATSAEGFSKSLEVVAVNLEQATEKIRQLVKKSQRRLRSVVNTLSREE